MHNGRRSIPGESSHGRRGSDSSGTISDCETGVPAAGMGVHFGRVPGSWLAWLIVLCAVSGCSPSTEAELSGRSFALVSSSGIELVPGRFVGLRFPEGEMRIGTGCNEHWGPFEIDDSRLVFDGGASTLAWCAEPAATQETRVLEFMSSRPTLQLNGHRLTLRQGETTLEFLDRVIADPDRPLVGTSWSVEMGLDRSVGGVPMPTPGTVLFGADGSLQVSAACSTGGGRFTMVASSYLMLTDVRYTTPVCMGASAEADARVIAVLSDGSVSFFIASSRLQLARADATANLDALAQ